MEHRNQMILTLLIGAVILWIWLEFAFQRRLLDELASIVYNLEGRLTSRFADMGAKDAERA